MFHDKINLVALYFVTTDLYFVLYGFINGLELSTKIILSWAKSWTIKFASDPIMRQYIGRMQKNNHHFQNHLV